MVSAFVMGYFLCFHASVALQMTDDDGPSWRKPHHHDKALANCRIARKNALQMVSRTKNGTALIVGANVGAVKNDPSWKALVSPNFDHLDKVFMEPHPGLFKKLEENVKKMPRAKAIRAAVTDVSGPMKMYCLGLNENGDLTPEAKATPGFNPFWSQICTGSRERLLSKYDVMKDVAISINISALVVELNVPTVTAAKLLEAVPSSVQYLQIDVEGFDDQVLTQFPFRSTSFRPLLVLFEYVLLGEERTNAAINFLSEHGYNTCFEHQNVIGILHGA
jgi:FkbM family methyltransferase